METPPPWTNVDDAAVARALQRLHRSALPDADLRDELRWFREVAAPIARRLDGAVVRSVSEDLPVHRFERDVLAPLFTALTGIHVAHETMHEGEVVQLFAEQIGTGRRLYHDFILDTDNIGLIARSERVVDLTAYLAGEGRDITSARLDLEDFLDLDAAKDYDGRLFQLPDQSFPIVYWYRADWFADPAARADFRARHGRELAVPRTWAEYEQIAAFFTGRRMTNPDGSTVQAWGHLDYYKVGDVSLGWRIADVQLSNAGVGDPGIPNGVPVDEYGIRVVAGVPVGATVARGGALDGPAAVYALETYLAWARWAPPEARQLDWSAMGRRLARGDIAQTIYFCTVFSGFDERYATPGPLVAADGEPVWRVAPQPVGRYWREGMKVGYKDVGAHTIPRNVRHDFRRAAWLWAQFATSKATAMLKLEASRTPVRRSTLVHPWTREYLARDGGVVELLSGPSHRLYTSTGMNVPHYPAIAALWYEHVSRAVEGEPAARVMGSLARAVDSVLTQIWLPRLSPRLAGSSPPDGAARASNPVSRPITVVCAEQYPDAYMREGRVEGIQAEFVRQALLRAGFEPRLRLVPRARALALLASGEADAMFPVLDTPDVREVADLWPTPDTGAVDAAWRDRWKIMDVDHIVVTHAATTGPADEFDGELARLPTPVRSTHGELAEHLRAAGLDVELVRSDGQNFDKLRRDARGTVIVPAFVAEMMATDRDLFVHDRPVASQPTFLAFSRRGARVTASDRLRTWEALEAATRDHVAMNMAFAEAIRAARDFR